MIAIPTDWWLVVLVMVDWWAYHLSHRLFWLIDANKATVLFDRPTWICILYYIYNLYNIFGARNDGSFDISLNVPVLGVNRPIRSNETNPELHARLSPHLFQRTQRAVPGWLHQWFCGYRPRLVQPSFSADRRFASPAASGTKCLGKFCGMTQWNELESPIKNNRFFGETLQH